MKKLIKSPLFICAIVAVILGIILGIVYLGNKDTQEEATPENVVHWSIDSIENSTSYISEMTQYVETELPYKDGIVKISIDGFYTMELDKTVDTGHLHGHSYVRIDDDTVQINEEKYVANNDKYRLVYVHDTENDKWICTKDEEASAAFYDLLTVINMASNNMESFEMTEENVEGIDVYKLTGIVSDSTLLIDNLKWNGIFQAAGVQTTIPAHVEICVNKSNNCVSSIKVDMTKGFTAVCNAEELDLDIYSMSVDVNYREFTEDNFIDVPFDVLDSAELTSKPIDDWQDTRFVDWFEKKAEEEANKPVFEYEPAPEDVDGRTTFTINGKKMWVGMPVTNMLSIASLDESYYTTYVLPGETLRFYFVLDNGNDIAIDVYNPGTEMAFVTDCVVGNVELYKLSLMDTNVEFEIGVTFDNEIRHVEKIFGKCSGDNIVQTKSYTTYTWQLTNTMIYRVQISNTTKKIVSIFIGEYY